MPISQISLASVCREFCDYVESLEQFDSTMVSGFLAVASTLILIKARSLLPDITVSLEEETDIAELEQQLEQYRLLQQGALHLQKLLTSAPSLFSRESDWENTYTFLPDKKLSIDIIHILGKSLVEKSQREETPKTSIIESVTIMPAIALSDIVATIQKRIGSGMSFWDMVNSIIPENVNHTPRSKKLYTIVSFLGLLELIKDGAVTGHQESIENDILISQKNDKNTGI
jgi:segregation and condensation protein A